MAKIITCNTNGIRSAAAKGFFDWLQAEQPDVVCIQETKAQVHQLSDPVFSPAGYYCYTTTRSRRDTVALRFTARSNRGRSLPGWAGIPQTPRDDISRQTLKG